MEKFKCAKVCLASVVTIAVVLLSSLVLAIDINNGDSPLDKNCGCEKVLPDGHCVDAFNAGVWSPGKWLNPKASNWSPSVMGVRVGADGNIAVRFIMDQSDINFFKNAKFNGTNIRVPFALEIDVIDHDNAFGETGEDDFVVRNDGTIPSTARLERDVSASDDIKSLGAIIFHPSELEPDTVYQIVFEPNNNLKSSGVIHINFQLTVNYKWITAMNRGVSTECDILEFMQDFRYGIGPGYEISVGNDSNLSNVPNGAVNPWYYYLAAKTDSSNKVGFQLNRENHAVCWNDYENSAHNRSSYYGGDEDVEGREEFGLPLADELLWYTYRRDDGATASEVPKDWCILDDNQINLWQLEIGSEYHYNQTILGDPDDSGDGDEDDNNPPDPNDPEPTTPDYDPDLHIESFQIREDGDDDYEHKVEKTLGPGESFYVEGKLKVENRSSQWAMDVDSDYRIEDNRDFDDDDNKIDQDGAFDISPYDTVTKKMSARKIKVSDDGTEVKVYGNESRSFPVVNGVAKIYFFADVEEDGGDSDISSESDKDEYGKVLVTVIIPPEIISQPTTNPDGVILHINFDDTIADQSGNSFPVHSIGDMTYENGTGIFSGNNFLDVSHSNVMNVNEIGIVFLIDELKSLPTTDAKLVIRDGVSYSRIFQLAMKSDGRLYFYARTTDDSWGIQIVTTRALISGEKYRIVAFFDQTNGARLWVNEELWGSDTSFSGTLQHGTAPIEVGGTNHGDYPLNASVNDLKIYNHGLTEDEVLALVSDATASFSADPVSGDDYLDVNFTYDSIGDVQSSEVTVTNSGGTVLDTFDYEVSAYGFTNPGNYDVTLTVTDSNSNTDSQTISIEVLDSTATIDPDIIAVYEFRGNVNDSSGNENNLIPTGTVAYQSNEEIILNGSTRLEAIDSSVFDVDSIGIKMGVTLNGLPSSGNAKLVMRDNTSSNRIFQFYVNPDGKLQLLARTTGDSGWSVNILTSNSLTVGQTYGVAFSFDEFGDANIWVNGVLWGADTTFNGTLKTGSALLEVGGTAHGGWFLNGRIDYLDIYSRGLTETDL